MNDGPRHNWVDGTERRAPGIEFKDGCDRTLKTCAACAIVKVTIHYPDGSIPGREWITASGAKWEGSATPPCIAKRPTEVQPV
jgi:hypothetical protein